MNKTSNKRLNALEGLDGDFNGDFYIIRNENNNFKVLHIDRNQ